MIWLKFNRLIDFFHRLKYRFSSNVLNWWWFESSQNAILQYRKRGFLKEVFAKNLRGCMLWSLPILFLSVASIRSKLLKPTYTEERPYKCKKLQHSTRIVKNQINSKQIVQLLQPIVIDAFVFSWYFIIFSFHDLRVTFENIYSRFEDFW